MTDITRIKYSCPRCSKSSDLTIWKSVNTQLNPELKAKVMDGSLFVFHCPFCNYNQEVVYAVLYHAQQDRYMIWWLPKDENGKQDFNPRELELMARMMKGYRFRLVSSFNKLREKILIFDSGLDDRAIELLKRHIWSAYLEREGIRLSDIFFSSAYQEDDFPAIEFFIFLPDGNYRTIKASGNNGYPRALEMMKKFKVPSLEPTQWRVVDETYWDLAEQGQG